MEYIQLGNSDLKVSRICLGCMGFGDVKNSQHTWIIDEQHTREIVKKALDMGINFFDIDIAYQSGTSEQYLGRALKNYTNREDVVAATKLHHIEGAVKAVDLKLTDEDIHYLEEAYVPHALVGVMAQNTLENAKQNMYGQ